MKPTLSTFLFLLAFLWHSILLSQLVNIESRRMQTDSLRFVLKSDLWFSYSDNDGAYLLQVGSGLSTQWKTKNYKGILYFIGNFNLARSRAQDFQNSWFFHVRYNQKLSDLVRLEGFVQSQNNELLSINSRNLLGAGIRLKFISTDDIKAYMGNSYMYEVEESDDFGLKLYNHRNSSYLSVSISLADNRLDLTNTIYYQPLYRDFNNYRILQQFKAEVPITKKLKFSGLFNYFLNSLTPAGDSEYSSLLSMGLTFEI
ncbi:DUF481 domain-containing protein [Lentiprolixibacter aurantiacus]|uniref:DUF481 domain-containing protein n=1 Tax=Lentiprolixibacter aurantiacus TaxID=2993939 RepID=A0AAE3SPV1_9FLAO|nr:DUF481 domain-containing protein [Lentiprolixibacter aurantiacus]MCX2719837.1 DUF481 domain-containing protein [Lentiprolixibacter aurantiacus]